MFEKLAHFLACWHGTLAHSLPRWHVKMRSWHVFSMLAWRHVGHVNHAGTKALWRLDHVGTQACMARDLANSSKIYP